MSVDSVFVYGTLQREQCRGGCWPCPPTQIQAATVRGRLFDLGAYPAMTLGHHRVAGEVWHFDTKSITETLRELDLIEDFHGQNTDLYRRQVIECEILGHRDDGAATKLPAYTYVYARPHELDPASEIQPSADGRCYWRKR